MNLMHTLFVFAAQHHFTITMQHFPSKTNSLADASTASNSPNSFLLLHRPVTAHPDPWNTRYPQLDICNIRFTSHLPGSQDSHTTPGSSTSFMSAGHNMITFYLLLVAQPPTHGTAQARNDPSNHLSAISACHWDNRFADPCKDNPLLTLIKCGVTRSSKCLPDQCYPITYTNLRHLIPHLKSDQIASKKRVKYWECH